MIDKVDVSEILRLNDLTFDYLGADGIVHTGFLMTNKAHNFILDITLSVGVLGLIFYILLFVFFLWCDPENTILGYRGNSHNLSSLRSHLVLNQVSLAT